MKNLLTLALLLCSVARADYVDIPGGSGITANSCPANQFATAIGATGALSCSVPAGGGTVTDVTGSAPIVSSGGNTPAISCNVASGSQPGCLAASDYASFAAKQSPLPSPTPSGAYLMGNGTSYVPTPFSGDVTFAGPVDLVAKIQGTTVSGTTGSGNVAFSAAPTFTGTMLTAAQTASGQYINTTAGALSTPAALYTGSPVTGGNGTTTKPLILIEDAATSTGWNTSGTYLGINAKTGFGGMAFAIANNGVVEVSATAAGVLSAVNVTGTTEVTVGGTGILGPNNATLILGNSRTFSSANSVHTIIDNGETDTASSGTSLSAQIKPTWNQTSTAGAVDLDIDRTETATGSGVQLGIRTKTGATTEFSVDHNGNIIANGTTLTMANIASVTPNTAACFSTTGVLGTDSANCIASLREYKQDIEPMDGASALDIVNKLGEAAVYYRYTDTFLGRAKDNPHARDTQPGFIAEEVEAIDPRYASYNGDKLRGVKYEQMVATEAAAIRELTKRIEQLERSCSH